jgi:hypothetical protein
VQPIYEEGLNKYVTYEIEDTLLVLSGEYYVGWIKTTERILNIGFDRNTVNNDKIFYNLGQGWQNSGFSGSLMIRPIMGKALPEEPVVRILPNAVNILHIYPNPASHQFRIELPDAANPEEWSVTLYDLQGKSVYFGRCDQQQHPISHLPDGIYILKLDHKGNFRAGRKLMIMH